MKRTDMISIIGNGYFTSNIENDEWSYLKAYKDVGLDFIPIKSGDGKRTYQNLDLRFVKNNISILIETKKDFNKDLFLAKEQLSAYVKYEIGLTGNKIIAILANTSNDEILVWKNDLTQSNFLAKEIALKSFGEFEEIFTLKINNKEQVMKNTYLLNELLHKYGITEKLRSQFVGTCLLALKNSLEFKNPKLTSAQIRINIKEILEDLLNKDLNKAAKLALLDKNVLQSQDIRSLEVIDFRKILSYIESNILPYINDKSTSGQDLLNLFFVTFNKYVGKADKNQAFTPDHITDFMSKITNINKHSVILDPCCGSGAFLVRGMTQALDDCLIKEEKESVKKKQIYGIEYDEGVYGLATTNMLIHSDGNSNILNGSCFDYKDWIQDAKPNVILMNPPYNAQKKHLPKSFTNTWSLVQKEDPTKGLYFVKYICDTLNEINQRATLAVLLPVACAIGTSKELKRIKKEILEENALDAVFTLPNEIFYPGASASACCMVFKIGQKHSTSAETYFGYYKEDGFRKKKNLGRVEQIDFGTGESLWKDIEKKWIETYKNRKIIDGFSAVKKVSFSDEWLCEAYMKTDYSNLTENDFVKTINDYLSYLVKEGNIYES